jgi:hypothetical protein
MRASSRTPDFGFWRSAALLVVQRFGTCTENPDPVYMIALSWTSSCVHGRIEHEPRVRSVSIKKDLSIKGVTNYCKWYDSFQTI